MEEGIQENVVEAAAIGQVGFTYMDTGWSDGLNRGSGVGSRGGLLPAGGWVLLGRGSAGRTSHLTLVWSQIIENLNAILRSLDFHLQALGSQWKSLRIWKMLLVTFYRKMVVGEGRAEAEQRPRSTVLYVSIPEKFISLQVLAYCCSSSLLDCKVVKGRGRVLPLHYHILSIVPGVP